MTSRKTHVDEIERFEGISRVQGIKNEVNVWEKIAFFYFLGVLLVEVFIKVSIQNVLVMNLEENERFLGIWPLYLPIREYLVFMQSRETQITMVKWTNAGGQTERANERSFVYRPPARRRWRNVKTTLMEVQRY